MVKKMKILIVTGGSIDVSFAREYLKNRFFDKIIAADSGLRHCCGLGITPTEIVGDFDSLRDRELLFRYSSQGIPIKTFPKRKDDTDTQLAAGYAAGYHPKEIVFLGATGTRYDHTLANIGLLEGLSDEGIDGKIVDAHNEIRMFCGKTEKIFSRQEDWPYFSLVAWAGNVTGIDLAGFSYPLTNKTLTTSVSLGISNEIEKEKAVLRMKSGHLLVIRSRD